jgi:hypothetical protein
MPKLRAGTIHLYVEDGPIRAWRHRPHQQTHSTRAHPSSAPPAPPSRTHLSRAHPSSTPAPLPKEHLSRAHPSSTLAPLAKMHFLFWTGTSRPKPLPASTVEDDPLRIWPQWPRHHPCSTRAPQRPDTCSFEYIHYHQTVELLNQDEDQ